MSVKASLAYPVRLDLSNSTPWYLLKDINPMRSRPHLYDLMERFCFEIHTNLVLGLDM